MPRPITPTQFTVFTRASALAVKMSPRVISIIWPSSSSTSSAPPQLQADGARPRSCSQYGERSHRRSHQYVQPTPKETTSQRETLLVSALSRKGLSNPWPRYRNQQGQQAFLVGDRKSTRLNSSH